MSALTAKGQLANNLYLGKKPNYVKVADTQYFDDTITYIIGKQPIDFSCTMT